MLTHDELKRLHEAAIAEKSSPMRVARLELVTALCDHVPEILEALRDRERLHTLRPFSEYHEDYGCVIWYHLPIQEPPYIGTPEECEYGGTPTECARLIAEGWLTHWGPLPDGQLLAATDGAKVAKR